MTALPRYVPVARPVRAGIDPVPQPSCLELAYGKSGLTGLHSNLVVIHHRPQFQTLSGSVSSMDRSHHRSSALDKSPGHHTTMKSAQYGARIYDARSLNLARDRRILVQ